jgi:hypothetical protein
MAVTPVVTLMFPCAGAVVDVARNKTVITDPIHAVFYPADAVFPQGSGRLFVYVHLRESVGPFNCRIEVRDEDGRFLVRTRPKRIEMDVDRRFLGEELVFELPLFQIHEVGVLRIALFANHVPVQSVDLRILKAEK